MQPHCFIITEKSRKSLWAARKAKVTTNLLPWKIIWFTRKVFPKTLSQRIRKVLKPKQASTIAKIFTNRITWLLFHRDFTICVRFFTREIMTWMRSVSMRRMFWAIRVITEISHGNFLREFLRWFITFLESREKGSFHRKSDKSDCHQWFFGFKLEKVEVCHLLNFLYHQNFCWFFCGEKFINVIKSSFIYSENSYKILYL